MKLEEYRDLSSDKLFLAIIKKSVNWNEADRFYFDVPGFDNPISAADILEIAVKEALEENNEPISQENMERIRAEVQEAITPNLEEWYPVIVAALEDWYMDLSVMEKLDTSFEFEKLIPISCYYNNSQYSFEEDEGEVYLSIDKVPFNRFVNDYESGKI